MLHCAILNSGSQVLEKSAPAPILTEDFDSCANNPRAEAALGVLQVQVKAEM